MPLVPVPKMFSYKSARKVSDSEENEKPKKKQKKFGHTVLKQLHILLVTALSLVAALAWNSAFQTFFQNTKYLKHRGPWIYAIVVTIVAILLIIGFTKLIEKVNKED